MKRKCFLYLSIMLMIIGIATLHAQEKRMAIDYTNISYATLTAKADSCYMARNFQLANEVFSHILKSKESQRKDWYNAAAVAALCGENELALERLYRCQKKYKKWYSHNLENDADFKSLHSENQWKAICKEDSVRREKAEKNYDKPLISELQDILKKDQSIRYKYVNARRNHNEATADSLLKVMRAVDKENETHLFKILDTRGWVSRNIVGEATHVFFTILQHSGLENQKKYLPMVKQAVKNGDMTASQYAYYEDRINVFEGKPQRYGTQLKQNSSGIYEVCTLENPHKVDRWRKKAGLPPLKEYIKNMQTMH